MALTNLSQITTSGISTLADVSLNSITGVDATFTGNVSIAGTLTYDDVTNIDSVGLITARSGVRVLTGTATTALVVEGDARVTGILTVGSSSLTLDGTNNVVNVGTALTLGHTQGLQFHTQNLHSQGFDVNNVNATGIVTAGVANVNGSVRLDGRNGSNRGLKLDLAGSSDYIIQESTTDDIVKFGGTGSSNFFAHNISSGNVGIGTDNPAQKLHVFGNTGTNIQIEQTSGNIYLGSSGNTRFGLSSGANLIQSTSVDFAIGSFGGNNLIFGTNNSERLRITSGGKLLAGHTASRDVFRETRVQISGASGDDAGLSIYSTEDGIAGPNLILGHSRNGDAVNSGDVLGDITFVGHDSNNLNSRASIIRSIMTANGTINSLYADLTFYTKRNSNGYPDESLRITSAGKVGINAANPNSLLEVRGTAGTYTNGITVFTGNTTHSGSNAKNGVGLYSFGDALKGGLSSNLLYSNSSTPSQSYATRSSGKIEISNTTTSNQTSLITFGGYYKGTTTFVERLRISSDGKIGINNSAPLYAMHFKNAMGSSPSFIHMEVTGTNTVGGGGGIAFDTSASNAQSNNGLYLATISGIRNSSDDGSNDLVFKTTRAGAPGDDGNDNSPKERLRIDSSGNAKFISNARQIILRNDGSSGQPKIDFRNAADSGDAFAFINGATLDLQTGGTTRFHITSNGSIATGGLLPTDGSFCVNSTIRSQNSSSNISYIGFTQYTSNTSVGGMFSYIGGDGRNTGYLTFNTNDTERLRITSGGDTEIRNIVSGITNSYSQYLKFRTTQTNGQSAVTGQIAAQGKSSWGGALVFYTKPANGSPNDTVTERLRIDQNGGIIKGSTNSSSSSQVIQMFFNKRGTCKGKRVHQGSGSGSTTHSLLTINSWQSSNTRVFCYVTVHYVNPVANLGGRMETYAAANYGGTRNTGTFAVADGGRWGSPNGTMSLSWNGNTLQLNTFNNAYMEYSVDITYVAYDGASITFATN